MCKPVFYMEKIEKAVELYKEQYKRDIYIFEYKDDFVILIVEDVGLCITYRSFLSPLERNVELIDECFHNPRCWNKLHVDNGENNC